jgi:hypothetical protein
VIVLSHTRLPSSTKVNTICDNLVPGMVAACRWGVESGELMFPGTFGHVPTRMYMSYRPSEPFVSKQQSKQYVSAVYCD